MGKVSHGMWASSNACRSNDWSAEKCNACGWQVLPALWRSIGVCVFGSPPPLFMPLGAQLLAGIVMLGLARSMSAHMQHRRCVRPRAQTWAESISVP